MNCNVNIYIPVFIELMKCNYTAESPYTHAIYTYTYIIIIV